MILDKNVLPIIIGGSHDMDLGQYTAYEGMDKLISVLNIDAYFDMEEGNQRTFSENHTNKILLHEPNFLFNYNHLGYQSYLVDQRMINTFEKLYFEAYRLGHFRQDFTEVEPVIRDADMISFDITSIRSTDAPGTRRAQPFGITGEEACQICWYAGLNQKLSSAGFYEYNPDFDDARESTAMVVATMVWYFIEGFHHRKHEADFKSNDYTRYVVSMPVEPETLIFFKSRLSEKWWMSVPYPSNGDDTVFDLEIREKQRIIPCSYSDYQTAMKGEIPDRWINAYSRLI
jgi:formiminoglutamase